MVTHVARHFARDVGHHTRAPGSVRNQGVDTVMNCYHLLVQTAASSAARVKAAPSDSGHGSGLLG
jgi:hypothetical protein